MWGFTSPTLSSTFATGRSPGGRGRGWWDTRPECWRGECGHGSRTSWAGPCPAPGPTSGGTVRSSRSSAGPRWRAGTSSTGTRPHYTPASPPTWRTSSSPGPTRDAPGTNSQLVFQMWEISSQRFKSVFYVDLLELVRTLNNTKPVRLLSKQVSKLKTSHYHASPACFFSLS